MDKPEALLLAEVMSLAFPGNLGIDKAAAELRRLARVEAQRDALLEALQRTEICGIVRTAIKAAEEGK